MKLQDISTPSSRKLKAKRKAGDGITSSVGPDPVASQGCSSWSWFYITFSFLHAHTLFSFSIL
jgi:hypothetical protein